MSSHQIRTSAISASLMLIALALALLGCGLAPSPAAPAAPPVSTQTPLPLYQQVKLTPVRSEETDRQDDYTITMQLPSLTGSDDARVQAFNSRMRSVVAEPVARFKKGLKDLPPTPIAAASFFDVRYALLSPPGDILSVKFEMMGYVKGAAHPYHLSPTTNFDLAKGRELALADLFLPASGYLDTISEYCIQQLKLRDIAFDESMPGAEPTVGNYRDWNITPDGLLITFEEYQVAAYAAGPQTVLVPYGQLRSILRDPGPLSSYLH
jgi:hypothetical protein